MNPIIISSNNNNRSIVETHRFLWHIMTTVVSFWLKSKIYPEKVPLMINNTLTRVGSFTSIYAFWDINSTILQHVYLMHLICTTNHLRKFLDSMVAVIENRSSNYYCIIKFYCFSRVNQILNWIFSFSYFQLLFAFIRRTLYQILSSITFFNISICLVD